MVNPDMLVTMSPGLLASPSGIFSLLGITPVTLMGNFSSAMALMTPNTVPAPHMSYFISSIAWLGLMDTPPESKVRPLPTSTTGFAPRLPPLYSIVMSLAG